MIIFIEDRQLVVDGYKNRFEKAGETLVRLSARDLIDWIETIDQSELAAVEAILVGESEHSEDAIQAIRKKLDVPVVALLESRSLEILINYYRRGVDDVVVKPVHFEELLIRIATIKKRGVQPVTETSSEPITVFFDGRDPEVGGRPFLLPRRERRILEYLAGINGRRVTKAQIFSAVYGIFDEQIEETVIESHISKLRKKLRAKLGKDPIDSKRYLGYRLDPASVSTTKTAPQPMVA